MPHRASHRRVNPRLQDVAEAFALLTRLPIPAAAFEPRGAPSAWAWPLAGLAVGLIAAAVATGGLALGLGSPASAGLALTAQALATGALHEDGLADCADGFWGGRTPERRLAIMADSRVGSYGVLALILVTLLRWSALAGLLAAGWTWGPLLAAAALSRWPMALALGVLRPTRPGGLGAGVGRPTGPTLALGAGTAAALAFAAAGAAALVAALAALGAAVAVIALARAKIGGQTGDVCGAAQQASETAALLALLAVLG